MPCLTALAQYDCRIVAVLTQPDRPAGRGRVMTASPVKKAAMELGVPILQPKSLKSVEAAEAIAALDLDLLVVVAYGLILPRTILRLPRYGCINVHASLLPRWRGAAPIQRALMAGDTRTGVTIMQMDEGLDTGDMLYKAEADISACDTGGSLHDRLAALGAGALIRVLDALRSRELAPVPQDDAMASYAEKISKRECGLDWNEAAAVLARKVRAFNPWPVAESRLGDRRVRIWEATAIEAAADAAPGVVVAATASGIDVATGEGCLRLQRLQLPGKKAVAAAEIINSLDFAGREFG